MKKTYTAPVTSVVAAAPAELIAESVGIGTERDKDGEVLVREEECLNPHSTQLWEDEW